MSLKVKTILIVASYAIVTALSALAYHHFYLLRDDLKFWIPQLFLMILIVVTTVYVLYTAELIKETRQLQQRPMIRVTIGENNNLPRFKFRKSFEFGSTTNQEAIRVVGGQQLQEKYVTVQLTNIGQTTVREIVVRIELETPKGKYTEEQTFNSDIGQDRSIEIAVAPLCAFMSVEVKEIIYGDGLRRYVDTWGNRAFTSDSEKKSSSISIPEY